MYLFLPAATPEEFGIAYGLTVGGISLAFGGMKKLLNLP